MDDDRAENRFTDVSKCFPTKKRKKGKKQPCLAANQAQVYFVYLG